MLRETVDGWVDPAVAFAVLFARSEYAFWLDAGVDATGGTSRMGAAGDGSSVLFASAPDDGTCGELIRIDPRTGRGRPERGDLFEVLRGGAAPGGEPCSGWAGWFGYEFGAAACGVPIAPRTPSSAPDAAWMRADRFITFSHGERTVTVCAAPAAGAEEWVTATVRVLRTLIGRAPAHPAPTGPRDRGEPPTKASVKRTGSPARPRAKAAWRHDDAEYLALIRRCQQHIAAGDAYQLCLTNTATITASVDPVDTYLRLRASSPTANGGLLRFGDWSLASASPERFLSVAADGRVQTRPIKGTRPRGANDTDDRRLRDELASDQKERAENLMIVDLMRNDLGRVARLGTVVVSELLAVESYRQVHQLVSTVTADLADGIDALDAVRSCFPAGSMTGAPKLSAMRILNELERGPRGPYAGCFGRIDDDGSLELAMIIRSIVIGRESVTIGAGGGITALSVPESELAEVAVKAQALLDAVSADIL